MKILIERLDFYCVVEFNKKCENIKIRHNNIDCYILSEYYWDVTKSKLRIIGKEKLIYCCLNDILYRACRLQDLKKFNKLDLGFINNFFTSKSELEWDKRFKERENKKKLLIVEEKEKKEKEILKFKENKEKVERQLYNFKLDVKNEEEVFFVNGQFFRDLRKFGFYKFPLYFQQAINNINWCRIKYKRVIQISRFNKSSFATYEKIIKFIMEN